MKRTVLFARTFMADSSEAGCDAGGSAADLTDEADAAKPMSTSKARADIAKPMIRSLQYESRLIKAPIVPRSTQQQSATGRVFPMGAWVADGKPGKYHAPP